MRFMMKAASAVLGLAMLALPQMASAQGYQPGRVLQTVETEDLQAVALSLNHIIEAVGTGTQRSVRARTGDGLIYFMTGTACDQDGVRGCRGVMMQVRFDIPDNTTLNSLAAANRTFSALNSWADVQAGMMGVTRYVVLDGGVTMANLRENANVMIALTPAALNVIAPEPQAAQ